MNTIAGGNDLPRYRMSLDNPSHHEFHDEIERARQQHWLHRWLCGYIVLGHHDVTALLRDRRLHQAAGKVPALLAGQTDPVSTLPADDILLAEGEKHTRLRRIVSETFSPRSIDQMRPGIRARAHEIVRATMGSAQRDADGRFIIDYLTMMNELPISVIAQMLGTDASHHSLYDKWAESHFQVLKSSSIDDHERDARLARDAAEFDEYCSELIEMRRGDPGNDLLSRLIAAEETGDRLTTPELVSLVRSVIAAGIDTTRNQLGSMMALIIDSPGAWMKLKGSPGLVPAAVEESLRLLNPIRTAMRIANEDFDYRGVHFPKGTLIALSLSGASRDPHQFVDSSVFQPSRGNSRDHLAFSHGVHHCLGAALARAELQEALAVLLENWHEIALVAPIEWKHAKLPVWGPSTITLAVTAPNTNFSARLPN